MEKWVLIFLCQNSMDTETMNKCQQIIKLTVRELQIYQTIKEKEKYYRDAAEDKLTKPGFWLALTAVSSVSSQRLYLTGHNVMGIDSVNLKLGKESEIGLTWRF